MTITDDRTPLTSKGRYRPGMLESKRLGYGAPDHEPSETDILDVFRVTARDGVDPEAAAAGESSTATWTVLWTDRPAARRYGAAP